MSVGLFARSGLSAPAEWPLRQPLAMKGSAVAVEASAVIAVVIRVAAGEA